MVHMHAICSSWTQWTWQEAILCQTCQIRGLSLLSQQVKRLWWVCWRQWMCSGLLFTIIMTIHNPLYSCLWTTRYDCDMHDPLSMTHFLLYGHLTLANNYIWPTLSDCLWPTLWLSVTHSLWLSMTHSLTVCDLLSMNVCDQFSAIKYNFMEASLSFLRVITIQ